MSGKFGFEVVVVIDGNWYMQIKLCVVEVWCDDNLVWYVYFGRIFFVYYVQYFCCIDVELFVNVVVKLQVYCCWCVYVIGFFLFLCGGLVGVGLCQGIYNCVEFFE